MFKLNRRLSRLLFSRTNFSLSLAEIIDDKFVGINPELYKLLNTKAKDLPNEYKYLVNDIAYEESRGCESFRDCSLLDYIMMCINQVAFTSISPSYFLLDKKSEEIIGFIHCDLFYSFRLKKEVAAQVKMVTLRTGEFSKEQLVNDIFDLLYNLLIKYPSVSWSVRRDNKDATNLYDDVLKLFKKEKEKGEYITDRIDDNTGILWYSIFDSLFE